VCRGTHHPLPRSYSLCHLIKCVGLDCQNVLWCRASLSPLHGGSLLPLAGLEWRPSFKVVSSLLLVLKGGLVSGVLHHSTGFSPPSWMGVHTTLSHEWAPIFIFCLYCFVISFIFFIVLLYLYFIYIIFIYYINYIFISYIYIYFVLLFIFYYIYIIYIYRCFLSVEILCLTL